MSLPYKISSIFNTFTQEKITENATYWYVVSGLKEYLDTEL